MGIYEQADSVLSSMQNYMNDQLISDPFSYYGEQSANGRIDELFRKNPEVYLDYLKDWDFTLGLRDIISSSISEVIAKTPIRVSFTRPELQKYEDFINKQLSDMNLREKLLDNLPDIIYRGAYFCYLNFNKDTKSFSLLDVEKPHKVKTVYRIGKLIGYLVEGVFVPLQNGICYSYRKMPDRKITFSKLTNETLRKQIEAEFNLKPSDMLKSLVVYTHYKSIGVFHGQVQKMFQIYLNEFIIQFLGLKDSIRQELITMTVATLPKKVINTSQIAQKIEQTLNQGSNILAQQDPQSLLQQVIFSMFNSVRVLPSLENYSNINKLEFVNYIEKRQQLTAENEDLRKQVTSNMGIPEELYMGTGNRWEILSRSDRFLTELNTFLTTLEDTPKQAVMSMMKAIGHPCELGDVKFSYLNDTPLQSQMSRNKTAMYNEMLKDTLETFNNVTAIMGTGFVEPKKLLQDLMDQSDRWGFSFGKSMYTVDDILSNIVNGPESPPPRKDVRYGV